MFIFSIIFSIFLSYILYLCFEYYGFKLAFLASFIYNLINAIIKNGTSNLLLIIATVTLISLISTTFDYFIYNRTNSFLGFLLLSIAIGFVISFCLVFILTLFSMGSLSNGILS